MVRVVLLTSSGEASAMMYLALEGDERFSVAGVATDLESAQSLVHAVDARALIFDNQDVPAALFAELQAALPDVALVAFAPGDIHANHRFIQNADELQWAETALSVGNSLAMILKLREPAF